MILGVAVLLMTGCGEEQRRREMQQEQQAFQQRELERLQIRIDSSWRINAVKIAYWKACVSPSG